MINSLGNFDNRDKPTNEFINEMSRRYPVERETDHLLIRKMRLRVSPPYRRPSLDALSKCLQNMLEEKIEGDFIIKDQSWFTGGVSKIQMGFTLDWNDPKRGPSVDRLVIRMDPAESSNTTSRAREVELIRLFQDLIPVPRIFWLDQEARWFPEPTLIYAFASGVTKPKTTTSGKVSGLGTVFGPRLRSLIAPQFIRHLGQIHSLDVNEVDLKTMDLPAIRTTQCALWQLNRGRRIWEEDRGEDFPLMEVAANWLERNLPTLDHASIVHGDYRSGNFLFDEASGNITAWLDWERGHVGDRHRDLAWTTQPTMGHYSEDSEKFFVSGLIPLDEFYQRYEDASGLSVDQDKLYFYRVLNCYQILCSAVATAYRVARLGKSHQDILLSRVKGIAPSLYLDLSCLLKERL